METNSKSLLSHYKKILKQVNSTGTALNKENSLENAYSYLLESEYKEYTLNNNSEFLVSLSLKKECKCFNSKYFLKGNEYSIRIKKSRRIKSCSICKIKCNNCRLVKYLSI